MINGVPEDVYLDVVYC